MELYLVCGLCIDSRKPVLRAPNLSVADCNEASVLRLRILQPYVPLHRGPSESVSASRHTGLKAKEHHLQKGEAF